MSAQAGVHGISTGLHRGGHQGDHAQARGAPLCPSHTTAPSRHISQQNLMENKPFMSDNRNYGLVNHGYVATAEAAPAMFAPPAPHFSGPSSPPAGMFDSLPGYEGTLGGQEVGFVPPLMPITTVQPSRPAPEQPHWNIPSITEDTARDAFIQYASSKCCYSTAPAKDGVITGMEAFNTYRYRLETFTESRFAEWAHEPFCGQAVDAYIQPPPGPWDIPAQAPLFFKDSKKVIKVPNTSSVKICYACLGMGRKPCTSCSGIGTKKCAGCSGRGFLFENKQCFTCNGRGRKRCCSCSGRGSKQCSTCHGKQQLLVYINLTVKWTNNSDDYVVERSSGLRISNLSKVTGKELFRDAQCMVHPVMGCPEGSVVSAAQRLVGEHVNRFTQTARILQQRQTIEMIPVSKVTSSWKGKSNIYFVFGNERKVHTDDYPATCCCSVM